MNVRVRCAAFTGSFVLALAVGSHLAHAAPPPVPTGLTATLASPTQVNLSWTRVTGASAYRVLRGTVAGGPYSQIGMCSAPNFSNMGLPLNKTYYYVVQSYNGTFSASSAQVSATTGGSTAPPVPPNPPTNLSATAVNGRIALTWTASTGAAVYHYDILRGTTSGGEVAVDSVQGNLTAYDDRSAPAAAGLYYQVRAYGAYGSSTSVEVFVPGAPTLTATSASDVQIDLDWTASTNATSYNVLRSTTSGGPYTQIATVTAPTTSHPDTGLTPDTTYYYVVNAVATGGTGTGTSLDSSQASASTGPPQVTLSSLTVVNDVRIDLDWTASSANATHYRISRGTSSGGEIPLVDVAAPALTYQDATLAANTAYYYTVTALNNGNGTRSRASNELSRTTAPAQPTGVSASASSSSQIDVGWTLSTGATSYTIRYGSSPGTYTTTVTGVTSSPFNHTGLAPNTTVYYVVSAINANGTSRDSTEVSATTNPAAVPLPSGAVSWYRAEDDFVDTLANNNGTQVGTVAFENGVVGRGFRFAGTADGNTVTATTNGFPTGNSDRTVEGWIRCDDPGHHTYQCIFAYGNGAGTGNLFALSVQSGQLLLDYQFAAVVGPTLTQGVTYHVAARYQAGTVTLFVNGNQVASQAVALTTPAGTQLTIGQNPSATWPITAFAGLVDELTFYDRALTPGEIQGIFNAGGSGKTGGGTWSPAIFPIALPGNNPFGDMSFDGNGDIVVVSNSAGGLTRVNRTTGATTLLAPSASFGGFSLTGCVYRPADGLVYVTADNGSGATYSVTGGGVVTFVANLGAGNWNATAIAPAGFGAFGGQIIAVSFNGSIVALNPSGPTVTTIATGIGQMSDLAFGPDGTLYVTGYGPPGLRAVTAAGAVTTLLGGQFADGICIDPDNSRIILADSNTNTIRQVTLPGLTVSTLFSGIPLGGGYYPSGVLHDPGTTLIAITWTPSMTGVQLRAFNVP